MGIEEEEDLIELIQYSLELLLLLLIKMVLADSLRIRALSLKSSESAKQFPDCDIDFLLHLLLLLLLEARNQFLNKRLIDYSLMKGAPAETE